MADPYIRQLAREALAQSAVNPAGAFSRSILGAQQLQRPTQQMQQPAEPYLRQQYPEIYGGLAGLMGMAPDELAGSVLDPNTARARAGAEIGFPLGTALQMFPAAQFTKGLPVGMSIKSVDDLVTKYPNLEAEKFINPSSIKPLNKVEDRKKYNEILESMKQEGWQGRPILAYEENGKTKALTGSHRIYAARKAGIDVPVVMVKPESLNYEDYSGSFTTFKDAIDDQRVFNWLNKAGDYKAAYLMHLED